MSKKDKHTDSRDTLFKNKATIKDIVVALIITAVATLLSSAAVYMQFPVLISPLVYVLCIIAVVFTTNGYLPAVLAVLLSTVASHFIFLRPYLSFQIDSKSSYAYLIILFITLLLLAVLSARNKREYLSNKMRAHQVQALFDFTQKVRASGTSKSAVIDNALIIVVQQLKRAAVIYIGNPFIESSAKTLPSPEDSDVSLFLKTTEKNAAKWVKDNNKPVGNLENTDDVITDAYYVPITQQNNVIGALGVSCKQGAVSPEEQSFLQAMASQTAAAIERQELAEEQRKTLRNEEISQTRHEFVKDLLVLSNDSESSLDARYFSEKALEALIALTEENEQEGLRTNWILLEDVMLDAVALAQNVDSSVSFILERLDSDVYVTVDNYMLTHALAQIALAAAAYADPHTKVELSAFANPEEVTIQIANEKKSIGDEPQEFSFDSNEMIYAKKAIEAHEGTLTARRRLGGGVVISVKIPR